MKILSVILLVVYSTRSNAANFIVPKQLTPVHGLFVKPSEDGTTGDLYVAASEDSGVDSQWLTEHPINFLPASTQSQAASAPVTFTSSLTSSSSPHEKTVTAKKKTVITSPPLKYAYAVPVSSAPDINGFSPYPFGLYAPHNYKPPEESQCQLEGLTPPTSLPAYPYPFYYPPVMSALMASLNLQKEGDNDGASRAALPVPHNWPGAYAYPYQYIMLDPTAWSQSQTTTTGKTTTEDADDD